MPQFEQGNIFTVLRDNRVEFAIIFGHIGFNEMNQHWASFASAVPELMHIRNPFLEVTNNPLHISEHQWLWFVPADSSGMSDEQVISALDSALVWANEKGLKSIATNGVTDANHGHGASQNRDSDDRRANFLTNYATQKENVLGFNILLINLSDIFMRNERA